MENVFFDCLFSCHFLQTVTVNLLFSNLPSAGNAQTSFIILSYVHKWAFLGMFENKNSLYFAHANEVRKGNYHTYERIMQAVIMKEVYCILAKPTKSQVHLCLFDKPIKFSYSFECWFSFVPTRSFKGQTKISLKQQSEIVIN